MLDKYESLDSNFPRMIIYFQILNKILVVFNITIQLHFLKVLIFFSFKLIFYVFEIILMC
jgi:hypothetical protein